MDPQQRLIYSVGSDGQIVRWQPDPSDGQLIARGEAAWYCSAMDPEKAWLYAGDRLGKLACFDLQRPELLWEEQRHGGSLFFILPSPLGVLTGGQDGKLSTGVRSHSVSDHSLRCALFTETSLFIGDSAGVIHCLSKDFEPIGRWQAHDRAVFALTLMGSELVSTGMDGQVRVWNTDSFTLIKQVPAHAHQGKGLAMGPELLLSCSMDKSVRIWDRELQLLKHLDGPKGGHQNCVNHIQWLDRQMFVSSSDDRSLIVWRIEYNL